MRDLNAIFGKSYGGMRGFVFRVARGVERISDNLNWEMFAFLIRLFFIIFSIDSWVNKKSSLNILCI